MIFKSFPDNDITREDQLYIAEIQEKLRALELDSNGASNVPVDGIYGPMTTAAVEQFQRKYGLPVTGIVNRETYYKLVAEYNSLLAKKVSVSYINGFLPTDGTAMRPGDTGDSVFFLNIMLRAIASVFKNIPLPPAENTYSGATDAAVRALQTTLGLPATGIVNLQTWNSITDLYNDLVRNFSLQSI